MANEAKPCACDIGDKMDYGGLGDEVDIEHMKAYIVNPASSSEKAIVVIHDIFGWQLANTRYMADLLASNGYIAICPDFFVGKEPWNPSGDWSKFQDWLKDKNATNINREVDAVLKYLKEKCGAKQVAAVGFCWGGTAVHHLALRYPQLKAGVSIYGIIRDTEDDKYQLHVPTLFIFGEKDDIIPLDQVTVLEKRLQEKCPVDFQVKVFPGQTHGFVHRKREDINPSDKPFIEEGRMDMLKWLKKYV
ncbi:carboxymethylenebutenolidase homolog [Anguilla rostrata]|uniref:Carboxymethylenebutenolidase homolog n=1 Tax=Anguilla anguilla TaxID=7936 RepID=A0A9D3MPI3_ANGAN|nr:carboxymethylenebutenolidase homolog [Anguilla anguilla]KAG5850178.1 hypothetical protein ANANG_G00079460 [Anguilla anguilla]